MLPPAPHGSGSIIVRGRYVRCQLLCWVDAEAGEVIILERQG